MGSDGAKFEEAAAKVRNLKKKPNDDEMLQVYSLYKQATVGDVNTPKPGATDATARAKWHIMATSGSHAHEQCLLSDSLKNVPGMSQDKAKEEYAKLVEQLVTKYGA
uniref:ACB domain-containing protein n=1 Tax=Parascaris equorum TaxID=6256 RepID=A0A914R545_PAREQ